MTLRSIHAVEEAIAARASAVDCDDGDLAADIGELRDHNWLVSCLPREVGGQGWGTQDVGTLPAFDALRALGRANLSVGRLFEGHMNAVKLIVLYARGPSREEAFSAIRSGALFGVWGADDQDCPLTLDPAGDTLRGAKRFASGLGLVDRAIVTVASDTGLQLLLLPCDDAQRADASGWRMGGMRATRSGRYDFDGVGVANSQKLGDPGDYLREPYFEGGIWRYCAAHLGGAEALCHGMRRELLDRHRADDPHQQRRLVDAAIALETARFWLLRAAHAVEARGALPQTTALSLLAREVTERSCRTVIETVEQALGMEAHIAGSPIERTRRDLALFLCQAAPDAKRARAAKTLFQLEHELEFL